MNWLVTLALTRNASLDWLCFGLGMRETAKITKEAPVEAPTEDQWMRLEEQIALNQRQGDKLARVPALLHQYKQNADEVIAKLRVKNDELKIKLLKKKRETQKAYGALREIMPL